MNKFVKQKQFNEKLRLQAQMKDKKARLELEEKNNEIIVLRECTQKGDDEDPVIAQANANLGGMQ